MNQFLMLAKDVLNQSGTPLIYHDIWKRAVVLKRMYKSEYDSILEDPEIYIKKISNNS